MKLDTLEELLVHELRDLHSAESQILEAGPKLAGRVKNPVMREAFVGHLQETTDHVRRLDQILADLGASAARQECHGMAGLIEESQKVLEDGGTPEVMDAALLCAVQRIEHCEIAGYGTAASFTATLGMDRAEEMLRQRLVEEKRADETLGHLADGSVNRQAAFLTVDA